MVELPTSPLRGRRHSATGLFERVAQLEKDRGSRVRRDRLYQLYFITVRGPRGSEGCKGDRAGVCRQALSDGANAANARNIAAGCALDERLVERGEGQNHPACWQGARHRRVRVPLLLKPVEASDP